VEPVVTSGACEEATEEVFEDVWAGEGFDGTDEVSDGSFAVDESVEVTGGIVLTIEAGGCGWIDTDGIEETSGLTPHPANAVKINKSAADSMSAFFM